MRLLLIRLADRLDDLLGHRWYWLCHRISESSWWGERVCGGGYTVEGNRKLPTNSRGERGGKGR